VTVSSDRDKNRTAPIQKKKRGPVERGQGGKKSPGPKSRGFSVETLLAAG